MIVQQPVLAADEVEAFLHEVFPEVQSYGFKVQEIQAGRVTVAMDASEKHLRPGGTVSGPTMFTLADCTAYILILSHIGKIALAVTTNLNINFLAKPEPGVLTAEAKMLKLGKRLAVCEITLYSAGKDEPVAHATATYSIPPRD